MRILIVEPAGNLWGSERALLDLIDSAPGLKFGVCCPPNSPIILELERRGVEVFPYFLPNLHRKGRWSRLRAAFGVLHAFSRFRPAVIHLNQSGSYRVVQFAARLLRIPIVCHVRIFEDCGYLARVLPDPRLLRGIIAVSVAIETELRRQPQLAAIPIHCLYDAYAATPAPPNRGIREPRLACVGRITPLKGQAVLLESLARTTGFPPSTECAFVGDGDAAYVSELKKASGTGSVRVRWLGFLRHVSPLLATASVLVCPSHREPLGRVIFEGWDAGLVPVVFAGAGGAAEIVQAAQGGIIYAEQSPAALGGALLTALALSEREAERLVANGREWMRANCNLEAYGNTISRLFAAALEAPGSQDREGTPADLAEHVKL